MTDEKKPVSNKPVQVSNAPPPITPLRGGGYIPKPSTNDRLPRWNKWRLMPEVKEWEAVALSLNIEPEKIKTDSNAWMGAAHPFDEGDDFNDRLEILKKHASNRTYFPTPCILNMANWYQCEVRLDEFAAWCIHVGFAIPPELSALAKAAPQAAPLLEAAPADDHDETLAALFEPIPVEALEKMFPAGGMWKSWAEKAASNGLKKARQKRGMFNPYKAGVWFIRKGAQGWDDARLNRTLANNLPARSHDDAHLLTGGIE